MKNKQSTPSMEKLKTKNINQPTGRDLLRARANKHYACYQRSEQKLHKAFNHLIRTRDIMTCTRDLTKMAQIHNNTLYTHYPNANTAIHAYEKQLQANFWKRIPSKKTSPQVLFFILLNFVEQNHAYFNAALDSHNHYILYQIMYKIKPYLTSPDVSDKTYHVYISHVIGYISCWQHYDHFDMAKIDNYVAELVRLRFYHIDA